MTIFLNERIGLSEDDATGYFHYFFFASYFFAIIGAVIADNWIGRFNTLLIGMSIIGGIGTGILGIGTILSDPLLM
jgi:solute carrier family 15 (oligopeptide transporter), member 1